MTRPDIRDCPRCYQTNGLILRYDVWTCHASGYSEEVRTAPKPKSTAGFFRRSRPRRENYCGCGATITIGSIRCRSCELRNRVKPEPNLSCQDCGFQWRRRPGSPDKRICHRCKHGGAQVIEQVEVTA